MVGVLVRLRLTLLRGQARGGLEKLALLVVGLLVAASTGAGVVAGLVLLRLVSLDLAGAVVVFAGAVAVLAWALFPLLTASDDVMVDPARFALLPLPTPTLAAGLLAATAVSPMGAATVLSSLALAVTFSRGPVPVLSVLVAVLAALLGSLTCLLASRALLTAAASVLAGRRGREAAVAVGVLLLSSLGLAGPVLGAVGERLRSGAVDALVQVLAWSPLGAAWSLPWAVAEGRWAAAGGRAAVAVATVALLWAVYVRAVGSRVRPRGQTRAVRTRTAPVAPTGPARTGVRGRALLPDTPLGAMTGRALRYWLRDSRYQVSVVALPVVVGLLLALPALSDAPPAFALLTGPLLGLMVGLTMLNELAFDGSAFWTGLAAGVRGRDDRLARTLALLLWAVPAVVVVGLAGALVGGRPELAPAAVGLGLSTMGVGLAVAAVSSVALPFPVPPAGSNPFSGNAGSGTAALVQQGLSLVALLPLLAPPLGLALWAWSTPAAGWVLLVVGTAYGAGLLAAGVVVGGRIMDRRGPELLGRLTR